MKNPLTILSITIATIAASGAPAYCQQLSFEQMTRMAGGNEPYLSSLSVQNDARGTQVQYRNNGVQVRYDTRGTQVQYNNNGVQVRYDTRGAQVDIRTPRASFQYGSAPGTSGDSGDFGNDTSGSYELANDDNTVSDYYGTTANQRPYSQGGVPRTTTAIQSLDGGYGDRFGKTEIPSAKFKYGFSNSPPIPYSGVSRNSRIRGANLPPVSTASVDLDIVDKGPRNGLFERAVYTPSAEGLRAIRAAQARGTLSRDYNFR